MVTFVKKAKQVSVFNAPLKEIAKLFNNPVQKIGPNGEVETKNTMAYTQKMVLAGIARTLCYQLNLTKDRLDQAIKDLARRQREHRGDEISEVSLNRACDWVEQLELQEHTLADFLTETKAMYLLWTGEDFVEPEPKQLNRKIVSSEAMARAARYTKLTESLPQTNGVETQD